MLLSINQLIVKPGHQLFISDVSWKLYNHILDEIGENSSYRVSYSQGNLEIMAPLPEHETAKVMIGDLLKALLEELHIEFLSLGSTTFNRESMDSGVEPDDCFYIKNEAAVRGKSRINLEIDPPPDLALEIDITSRTRFKNYEALGVSELWRFNGQSLEINVLQEGKYVKTDTSRYFSQFRLVDAIPKYIHQSKVIGRNAAMRAFRAWVREYTRM